MKKTIIALFLAVVMTFGLFGCVSSPKKNRLPVEEISFEVVDDSGVPVPTYSAAVKTKLESLINTVAGLVDAQDRLDKEDVDEFINEAVFPLFKSAKISEAKAVALFDFCQTKAPELFAFMSLEEPPQDLKAFYAVYFGLMRSMLDVLDADDAGKLFYAFLTVDTGLDFDEEVAEAANAIGRDKFMLLSRFVFKLTRATLNEEEAMIDALIPFMNTMLGSEGVTTVQTLTAAMLEVEMYYNIYSTVTDKEIGLILGAVLDVYAAFDSEINKNKTQISETYTALLPDYRALISLAYQSTKMIDIKKLSDAVNAPGSSNAVAAILLDAALKAYDSGITAAEKVKIDSILKDIVGNAQYYYCEEEIINEYLSWYYYDLENDEYAYVYERTYRQSWKKSSLKGFDAGSYAADPISALRLFPGMFQKGGYDNFNQQEKAIADFLNDYYYELIASFNDRLGGVSYSPLRWNRYEVRHPEPPENGEPLNCERPENF